MRRVAPALAVATVIVAALPAAAQEGPFYVGTGLGYNAPSDASVSGGAISNSIEFEGDWAGALSGGWLAWGTPGANGLRLELEGAYRNNKADSVSGRPATGEVGVLSFLGNAFWDIDLDTWLTPYLGGGLGYARVNHDQVTPIGGTMIDAEDFAFAWQLGGLVAPSPSTSRTVCRRRWTIATSPFSTSATPRAPAPSRRATRAMR